MLQGHNNPYAFSTPKALSAVIINADKIPPPSREWVMVLCPKNQLNGREIKNNGRPSNDRGSSMSAANPPRIVKPIVSGCPGYIKAPAMPVVRICAGDNVITSPFQIEAYL